MNKKQLLKIANQEIGKFPYESFLFFLGKIYQKKFLLCTLTTMVILHTDFGLIWTTPWTDEKNQFLIFANREIRKFPYENFRFFLGKIYQKFLSFCTLTTMVILHTEFGLIWTTPWPDEKDLFLNFSNCEICKVPYENLTFS